MHEAIIDMDIWEKVKVIMESKADKPARIYDGNTH